MFVEAQEYLHALVERKCIPYLDVCAYKDHKELWRWYGGDGRESVTGKEKILLYSATKPITAVCAMRLFEEGKLSLDDAVEKWLPAYKDAFILDEKGNICAPTTKMRIRHLLTMSAGLTYDYASYPIAETIAKNAGKEDTQTIVGAYIKKPLAFEPGERFEYSLCHDVLAAVIERASGESFSSYMRKIVFEPLGMTHSNFPNNMSGIVAQYTCLNEGNITKDLKEDPFWFRFGKDYESGGAGVASTMEDYIRFADTLACGGKSVNGYRLLKENTIKELYQQQLPSITIKNNFWCVQGGDYGYGMGVRTRMETTEWGLPEGEFGWDGAAGSYLMVDPVHHISIVITMHLTSWPNTFIGEHLQIVEKIYRELREGKWI